MEAESPSALRFLVDAQARALNVHSETIPRGSQSDTAQIQNTQSIEPNPTYLVAGSVKWDTYDQIHHKGRMSSTTLQAYTRASHELLHRMPR